MALCLGVSAESSFSGVWHLVDVKSVVCPNAPGQGVLPCFTSHVPFIKAFFAVEKLGRIHRDQHI